MIMLIAIARILPITASVALTTGMVLWLGVSVDKYMGKMTEPYVTRAIIAVSLYGVPMIIHHIAVANGTSHIKMTTACQTEPGSIDHHDSQPHRAPSSAP